MSSRYVVRGLGDCIAEGKNRRKKNKIGKLSIKIDTMSVYKPWKCRALNVNGTECVNRTNCTDMLCGVHRNRFYKVPPSAISSSIIETSPSKETTDQSIQTIFKPKECNDLSIQVDPQSIDSETNDLLDVQTEPGYYPYAFRYIDRWNYTPQSSSLC